MTRKTIAALGLCAVSIPLFAGCDSISFSSGESTVIRFASASSTKTGTSNNCMNDPNKTTTFRAGGTAMVYGVSTAAGDQFFLDTGTSVLVGAAQADGSYSFSGKATDIQSQMNTTITTVDTVTVTMTLAGDSVDGKSSDTQSVTCSGTCTNFTNATCTTSFTFVGVAVQGADVPPLK